MKISVKIKKCLMLANIQLRHYYDDSNKLGVANMYDETSGVNIKEFVGLNTKMYSFFKDDSSEHKKAKDVNKNVVATISHNEYKDALLSNKCLRHSMNRLPKNPIQ